MNRSKMVYFIMIFIFVWYAGALLAIKYFGISVIEALGIGTAGGIFLSAFKDAWQFFWRKMSPEEEARSKRPEDSAPPDKSNTRSS
jgi:hypothetical protein